MTAPTGHNDTKDVHKIVPLKYLSSFQRVLELLSINCEIDFIVTCSANYFYSLVLWQIKCQHLQ